MLSCAEAHRCSVVMRAPASKSQAKSSREAAHPPAIEAVARNASSFQRREWVVQRIGWALLAITLIAALTGVFGRGPVANQTQANESATIEYERFVRRDADTRWEITLRDAPPGGHAEIAIDAQFARNFEITAIHPEPTDTALSGGRWIYRFARHEPGEMLVVFTVEPERVGRHEGAITANGSAPFHLWQFTYP
jgi:hypothetical protein